jgi:hypothetical protein
MTSYNNTEYSQLYGTCDTIQMQMTSSEFTFVCKFQIPTGTQMLMHSLMSWPMTIHELLGCLDMSGTILFTMKNLFFCFMILNTVSHKRETLVK